MRRKSEGKKPKTVAIVLTMQNFATLLSVGAKDGLITGSVTTGTKKDLVVRVSMHGRI